MLPAPSRPTERGLLIKGGEGNEAGMRIAENISRGLQPKRGNVRKTSDCSHPEHMLLQRPKGLLAGFRAEEFDDDVPELTHCGEQWVPTGWRISPHRHAMWELYLQASGRTRWRVEKHHYRLAEGDFLAVGPGVEHWLAEQPRREYHIYFAGVDLRSVLNRLPESRVAWHGADHFVIRHAGGLAAPFGDLMQEVTGKRFARARGVQLALDRLVLAATRLRVPDGVGGNDLDHPATNRARYLIECEPERHWRLDQLARAAGDSP